LRDQLKSTRERERKREEREREREREGERERERERERKRVSSALAGGCEKRARVPFVRPSHRGSGVRARR